MECKQKVTVLRDNKAVNVFISKVCIEKVTNK